MNSFLNFRLFGTMCPPAYLLRISALFVLAALFGPSSTSAQGTELFQCPEKEYKFSGFPAETLCDENPNFVCETEIGVGTPFPKSSLWGASITGNVCIIGDFEIDAHFSFQNATVKINPGVTISVAGSPNGYDPGSSLSINNSKLFACTGLWKGIHIVTANNVTVSNNCNFTWDNNLPLIVPGPNPNFYYGLHIEKFALGSLNSVAGNLFSADITNVLQNVTATWFQGADVAGGTAISMTQNTWQMYGGPAIGVLINGDFPSTSRIDIYNNVFDVNGHLNAGSPRCIYSQGDRWNFDIIGNRFFSTPPLNSNSAPTGIDVSGSDGDHNDISGNHWEQGTLLYSYLCAISGINYTNTVYCSNTFANNNRSFCFGGANDGTFLLDNIAHGSQLIMLYNQSWIDDQDQGGNQWTAEYQGSVLAEVATPQAECLGPNIANFSEFFVHTAQSTAYTGPGFNPFHPRDLFPDNTIEWWVQANGTPVMDCIDEIVGPGSGDSKLKRAVADGSFATQFNNPSMTWQTQRALFFALKRTPALESQSATYTTFLTAKSGSNIDKFYQVATALDAARNGSATLVANAKSNSTAINNLLVQIEADDLAWQNATTATQKASAENSKKQHLGQLMQLLQNASSLQTSYKQERQTALVNIQQTNNSATPVGDWETYEKTSNDIFISYLQNGGVTAGQKQQLETIAAVCPKYGGMAVYRARGILPECAQSFGRDNYQGCYPAPTMLEPVQPRSDETQAWQNVAKAQVQPNPASGTATISVPEGRQGFLRLVNAFGQVVREQKIASSQTSIGLSLLPEGIYYVNILFTDGHRESLKLVVSR